ncbi:DUF389 domain-containing protein [Planktothrix mougeotii]|uniref:DUF389 domain-containing protein n=1 Tax=Planktothrix mougeotii LEGE 06226 TaxID=1828728 RepID=A0ABR9UJ11_9CYAN|nr:DUF389 domain-containing protein [Planktothrix mougeotii]MBE9146463.1 DUF389 domain-containing protein [Planktothrix mougeotii LEGE 06226]
MRQLLVQVPRGWGKTVLDIAQDSKGTNLVQFEAYSDDQPIDVVIVHVSNQKVGKLLDQLEQIDNLHISMFPHGVIALKPPAWETAQQVTNVQERSPIEVFIGGLQSIGSWRGFLGYAATAGIVVWIGLYTNTIYLLTAAMLIAPFAGPAMNVAIATAKGDKILLKRSLLRYFAALLVTILVTAFLSLIFQQQIPTSLMVENSQISTVSVLIPIAAGIAGAVNLMQSERSSLVSGAATGMLVAASLAPPAGLVGMAGAIGRWDMSINGIFLLLLQLVGINLSASIIFRIYGLSSHGVRYQRGQKWLFPTSLIVTFIGLISLLTWQLSSSPALQRSSRSQRATAQIQKAVSESDLAELIEANVRFTRPSINDQNTLLGVVYVQRQSGVTASDQEIRQRLTQIIQNRLVQQGFNVTPLIDVSVLNSPENSQ